MKRFTFWIASALVSLVVQTVTTIPWPPGPYTTVTPPYPPATPQIVNCEAITNYHIGPLCVPGDPLAADISHKPVDPSSAAIFAHLKQLAAPMVVQPRLVPEWGSTYQGTNKPDPTKAHWIGTPWIIVGKTTPLNSVTWIRDTPHYGRYDLGNAIDLGPDGGNRYQFGPNGDLCQSGPDRHYLILDKDAKKIYEGWKVFYDPSYGWQAVTFCSFDLTKMNPQRPDGKTSADAAGLPYLPLLFRYDELQWAVNNGKTTLGHALRFTLPPSFCRAAQVTPATHHAGGNTDVNLPVFGDRFRLKATYDVSHFQPDVQVFLNTLKVYGMFMADIGGTGHVSGHPDSRWNEPVWNGIESIPLLDAFEIVQRAGPISTKMGASP